MYRLLSNFSSILHYNYIRMRSFAYLERFRVFFVINSFCILAILFTNRLNSYGRRLRISGYNDICRKLVREVRFITFVPEFLSVSQIKFHVCSVK